MGWLEPKSLPQGADFNRLVAALEAALKEQDRHLALVTLVRELFMEGYDEGEALGVLEQFRAQLRQQEREAEEDDVMDVMDQLIGWCGPHARLERDADFQRELSSLPPRHVPLE
jgi:hypothetical protein